MSSKEQLWTELKRGLSATARYSWRAARLAVGWIARKATTSGIARRIRSKEGERHQLLLQIGTIVCARHRASPLQDEELALLCQSVADLETEIKRLRERLAQIMAAPLLPEDVAAEPLKRERAQSEAT